jgi:hypothetical protein
MTKNCSQQNYLSSHWAQVDPKVDFKIAYQVEINFPVGCSGVIFEIFGLFWTFWSRFHRQRCMTIISRLHRQISNHKRLYSVFVQLTIVTWKSQSGTQNISLLVASFQNNERIILIERKNESSVEEEN